MNLHMLLKQVLFTILCMLAVCSGRVKEILELNHVALNFNQSKLVESTGNASEFEAELCDVILALFSD